MLGLCGGPLWLRGKASVLLSEGRLFNPLVYMLDTEDTEPQTAPDVLVGTLHGSHRHHCMYELLQVALERLLNALKM